MSKVRFGILSTAHIGEVRVIPAIKKAYNAEVVAVASRGLDRARAFADKNDIPLAFGSYEELLASDEVDAIYNPLPNNLHAVWSIKGAEAGKPVLCEKPLSLDAAEGQRMVDAFKHRGVLFAEAFMYRFHPQTDRVHELIAEGAIGDVHSIKATFTFAIKGDDDGNIRLQPELGGGSLWDVGYYCVGAIRHIVGEEPCAVKGEAIIEQGVDVNFSGVLRFPSGVLGHFDCGLRTFREHTYRVLGSKGKIDVPTAFVSPPGEEATISVWRGEEREEIVIPPADHYQIMVEDFADALLNDRPPRFDPQEAVHQMQVLDALKANAGIARFG